MLISSLGKVQGPSFEQIWIYFTQGRFNCAKFGWNCPSGSGEEHFKILFIYFHSFVLSPLGKEHGPSFESPLPKDALHQVELKLVQWFWRRRINVKSLWQRCHGSVVWPSNGTVALSLRLKAIDPFSGQTKLLLSQNPVSNSILFTC